MSPLFADTFYMLAMLNEKDACHAAAKAAATLARQQRRELVTSAWVLTELGDALAAAGSRSSFLAMLDTLRSDRMVTIVGPTPELFEAAIQLYRSRPDKDWSLTDCSSFSLMKDRGIAEALTGDHHFEQAGFTALLK